MKTIKLLLLLISLTLLTSLMGCYSVDNIIQDLEENNYTVEMKTSEFDNIIHEYRILNENEIFAAYILEFDNNEEAKEHFDFQDYESRMQDEDLIQTFTVYENLIIAFVDENVFYIITGETYNQASQQ